MLLIIYLNINDVSSSLFQSDISRELPLLIFGAMALVGGVLVFVFPETRDQPMRQTVEEGEEFIRQNMCQFGPCKRFGEPTFRMFELVVFCSRNEI